MSSVDSLSQARNKVLWKRQRPDLPPGIHRPKLEGDVGWDLEAMTDVTIGPMESADVPVNAAIQMPIGFYADIRNRSSMARRGLYVDQNVIDTGYRGPLFVFIRNMRLPELVHWNGESVFRYASQAVTIKAGERIAQLIFHRFHPVWTVEVEELDPSERGDRGFGSTGV